MQTQISLKQIPSIYLQGYNIFILKTIFLEFYRSLIKKYLRIWQDASCSPKHKLWCGSKYILQSQAYTLVWCLYEMLQSHTYHFLWCFVITLRSRLCASDISDWLQCGKQGLSEKVTTKKSNRERNLMKYRNKK